MNEYQELAMRTKGPSLNESDALVLSALGLCGEAGEFADRLKKELFHGHIHAFAEATEELGDILWYVTRACEALGTDLEWVAEKNIRKLQQRYPPGS